MIKRYLVFVINILLVFLISCAAPVNEDNQIETTITKPTVEEKELKADYIYRHRDTKRGDHDREAYIWEIMGAALESTVSDYGSYEIIAVKDINQNREDYELIHNTGFITVISDSLNQNNIDNLNLLQVPILRNILGYRVFLIEEDRQVTFQNIETAEDLKQFEFGIGIGWNDKIILEHAGIEVYEDSEYSSLFKGVSLGIFDVFSRGINEIIDEYETYSKEYENLHIEEHILLYYPLPRYFWFSKTPEGKKLKDRLQIGLERIETDGTFYRIFEDYFIEDINRLKLNERVLIHLENPIYDDSYDKIDKKFRFNPFE